MLKITTDPVTNNIIGQAVWNDVTQEWNVIDAITKGALDFKYDEYALTTKLLEYSQPTYTKKKAYVIPDSTEYIVPATTMTSI